ncbi:MAG: DMT family transporter [Candidatus Promineifilaceae bacterium]
MTVYSAATTGAPGRRVLLAFAVFVLISGLASIAIRVTYHEMAPFWSGALRFGLAALVFWVLVGIKRLPLPRGRALLGAVLFGVLTVGLAFSLVGWGLVAIPARIHQILMALIPLYTLFLSAIQGVESMHARGVAGALLAVAGIAVTVGLGGGGALSLPHVAAILVGSLSIAEGGVLLKRFPHNPPLITNAIGITVGALMLIVVSLFSRETWTLPTQPATWLAFFYLVFVVTVVAFIIYLYVLDNWTASATSYAFVLMPLVTMAASALLLGEEITFTFLLGAALVLAGVIVGALLPAPSAEQEVALEACKTSAGEVLPRCS